MREQASLSLHLFLHNLTAAGLMHRAVLSKAACFAGYQTAVQWRLSSSVLVCVTGRVQAGQWKEDADVGTHRELGGICSLPTGPDPGQSWAGWGACNRDTGQKFPSVLQHTAVAVASAKDCCSPPCMAKRAAAVVCQSKTLCRLC